MSATNRGAVRRADDYYATPAWCVRALLASVQLPGGRWLEPAAGDGAAALGHGDKGQTATRHYVGVTEQAPELKLYKTGTDAVAKTR
jgi:hypothetical protein